MGLFLPELDVNSPISEAYRLLRTNLDFAINNEGLKSVLITSAGPGSEGKSTVSVNLAYALAETEKEVTLIDADLRKPRLHQMLEVSPESGLIDILRGEKALEEVTHYLARGIEFIPSGKKKPNTFQLINRYSFKNILEDLKEKRDLIIIDSAPLIISDSLSMAAAVDGVVLVVSMGESNRRIVKDSLKLLKNAGANILGLVANKIPKKNKAYYYTYY